MKRTKKFASLLLALVMVFAMSVTAFAAGTNTITVKNAVSGQKYELYKILDLSVNENKTAYSYTVNSTWADFFKSPDGKGLSYVSIDTLGYVIVGALLCGVIMWLIGKRNIVELVLVSILVPLGMWLVFYKMLSVNIPMGVLQPLRDLVDMIHF